jgi:hypothetical protein
MSSIEYPKEVKSFICELCSFSTNNKKDYNRHKMTPKHEINSKNIINEKEKEKEVKPHHTCNCGNTYKYRQGLNNHKKKCLLENNAISKKDELAILELCSEIIKQNQLILLETQELRKMLETPKAYSS